MLVRGMRSIVFFALVALGISGPVEAQSVIPLDGADAPNARAAQRPLGPNARAAQKPVGPNGALARESKLLGREVRYPTCAQAGVSRATPIRRGEPGYGRHLDPDGDGVACE